MIHTLLEKYIKILCLKYVILGDHLLKKLPVSVYKISQAVSSEFIQTPKGFRIRLQFLTTVLTSSLHLGSIKSFIWNEEVLIFLAIYYF